jgi:hypothetical protein
VLLVVIHLALCSPSSSSLILVVVVDLVIPEKCLVSIAPEEVFCSNVLVGVFDSLFQRWKVAPVLPMLVPQVPGVDAAEYEAWDNNAVKGSVSCGSFGM